MAGFGVAALMAAVFAIGFALAPTAASNWERLAAHGGRPITLSVSGAPQTWRLVEKEEIVTCMVTGPRDVLIDCRLKLPAPTNDGVPYLVEVQLDDQVHDWFKYQSNSSRKAFHPDSAVGDRDKIHVKVPEGSHRLGVKLMEGNKVDGLFIRIRGREGPDE